jgi:ComF family protein
MTPPPAALAVLDAAVFPRLCRVCGRPSRLHGACDACLDSMATDPARVCRRCARVWERAPADAQRPSAIRPCSLCRRASQNHDATVALGLYEDALRGLCLALKRPHNGWLAPTLATALLERHRDWIEAWLDVAQSETAPAVVAVPLHWRRRWARGYNQADALAAALARGLALPRLRPLRRVKATRHLAPLGAVRRTAELRRAFAPRRGIDLRGRDVLLVDDILTSGATCHAAARALRNAGAGRILAVVIARAEVPR